MGDIVVTRNSVIVPEGRFPLRGTTWTVHDGTIVSEEIPQWAIIVSIVGLFVVCVFSLLFLLVKEKRYSGFVSVTVAGEGLYHTFQFAPGPVSVAWANTQVGHARTLASMA